MNVIGHDHVATNRDVEAGFGTFGKNGERRMNFVASEKRFSLVSAKSDEIQGPIIKDAAQTWRPSLEIRFHTKHVATALRPSNAKQLVCERPATGRWLQRTKQPPLQPRPCGPYFLLA